jgi:mutator protein MutT
LPGGEVRPGESHDLALRRAMRESLAIRVRVGGLVASVRHTFTHLRVTINVYVCDLEKGDPSPTAHTALKWVRKSQFSDYAFPKAHHKFLHLL